MWFHSEFHSTARTGWLRAAVLGANDGIISTASLVMGVAAAGTSRDAVLIAGVAGLVAGAMSMAAGEYVSVSSQSDAEKSDLRRERRELEENPESEHRELVQIYIERGLDAKLANEVARQLAAHDALGAHARDELGLSPIHAPRPIQAALASAGAFTVGALLPLLAAALAPAGTIMATVAGSTFVFLVILGWLAAVTAGSAVLSSVARIAFWGVLALAVTAGIGKLFGTVI